MGSAMLSQRRVDLDNRLGSKIIIYLINPFIAFIASLFSVDKRSSRVVLYLWFILFGFSFLPMQEVTGDSYGYYEKFLQFQTSEFPGIVNDYFTGQSNYKDLYEYFAYWLVKSFTDNYHVFFALLAVVFGFFYIKSLKMIVAYFDRDNYWISMLLVLLFMLSNPIYNINGFRFWTAAWMGVYGALKVLKERKYQYCLLIAATFLVHGGFSVFIFLFLLGFILRKHVNIISVIYIISFFLSVVSVSSLLEPYIGNMPLFFSNFLDSYAEEGTVAEKLLGREQLPFYARFFKKTPTYYLNIMTILLLYLNRKKIIDISKNSLFVFALVILIMCNLLDTSVLSVSGRYLRIAEAFVIFTWMMNAKYLKQYNWFIFVFPLFYWYRLLFLYRDVVGISDPLLYLSPAPVSIIKNLLFIWQ